jgi:hypothetical protein
MFDTLIAARATSRQQDDLANGGTAFDQLVHTDYLTKWKCSGDRVLQSATGHSIQYLAREGCEPARFQEIVCGYDRRQSE